MARLHWGSPTLCQTWASTPQRAECFMCFRCLSLMFIAVLPCMAAEQRVLRVCADPNNMPFSNDRAEGFENKLAEMIAGKLDAKLEYTWWSERKSFLKNSLDQGRCDVVMGIPATLE